MTMYVNGRGQRTESEGREGEVVEEGEDKDEGREEGVKEK